MYRVQSPATIPPAADAVEAAANKLLGDLYE